ncbi:unnamed protein product, partial [Phaeothamnion confervicola]
MHEVASNCMYVSQMAFFARVSDPVIGGTYMTLLNTVANLGTKWPGTLSLWAMDAVTWKSCIGADFDDTADGAAAITCLEAGGACEVVLDGYNVQAALCVAVGIAWLAIFRGRVLRLQEASLLAW